MIGSVGFGDDVNGGGIGFFFILFFGILILIFFGLF